MNVLGTDTPSKPVAMYDDKGFPMPWLYEKANKTSLDTNLKIMSGSTIFAVVMGIAAYILLFGKRK